MAFIPVSQKLKNGRTNVTQKMGRVDTRIPDAEEELLDQITESENYPSRSELVREAIREMISRKIEREEWRK